MAICKFFQQGRCRNGDACRFEHVNGDTRRAPAAAAPPAGNRFSALSDTDNRRESYARPHTSNPSNTGYNRNNRDSENHHTTNHGGNRNNDSYRHPANGPYPYLITKEGIIADLDTSKEKPQWPFSAYGPGRDAPRQLFGGHPIEQSPEEVRLQFYLAASHGNTLSGENAERNLLVEADQQVRRILNDLDGAINYVIDGKNHHPNRLDMCSPGQFEGTRPTGAFTKPTPPSENVWPSIPAPQPSTFGQVGQGSGGFGQPSSLGQKPAFGQPSAPGGAFAKPSGPATTFGQPSAPGSGFGQPSAPGGGFGQSSGPATTFGQPSAPGSGFGQPSALGGGSSQPSAPASGFGQPSAPGGVFSKPSAPTSGFGAPSASSPFASAFAAPKAASPFAQPPAASPFAQPPSASPFAQPPSASPFAQPTTSPFNQGNINQPTAAQQPTNVFSQPSAPAFNAPTGAPSPFAPTPPQPTPWSTASPHEFGGSSAGASAQLTRNADKSLRTWKGRPVIYENGIPYFRNGKGEQERIFHPDGPPARRQDTEAADPAVYEERGVLEDAYLFVRTKGVFRDGVMPDVPPAGNWVGWDV